MQVLLVQLPRSVRFASNHALGWVVGQPDVPKAQIPTTFESQRLCWLFLVERAVSRALRGGQLGTPTTLGSVWHVPEAHHDVKASIFRDKRIHDLGAHPNAVGLVTHLRPVCDRVSPQRVKVNPCAYY